jgi:hypothetical protein
MFVAAELDLEPVLFLEQSLRGLGVVPEPGLGGFFEQFFLTRG